MSVTHERPPVLGRGEEPPVWRESSRPAWVAVLVAPFVIAGAVVIGFAIESWPWAADVVPLMLAATPILAGFALGLRSARTGNGYGALAAATAAAEALFIVMFLVGANAVEFASDGTSALVGLASGAVAFAVVEILLARVSNRARNAGPESGDERLPIL